MADQNLSEQAREAVLQAILKAAPKVINSPAAWVPQLRAVLGHDREC